jgi:hypothetical protein
MIIMLRVESLPSSPKIQHSALGLQNPTRELYPFFALKEIEIRQQMRKTRSQLPRAITLYVGYRDQKSFRFLGIPYADLVAHFEYSQPYSQQQQTVQATQQGSECPQYGFGNEDCLFLSIYTHYISIENWQFRESQVRLLDSSRRLYWRKWFTNRWWQSCLDQLPTFHSRFPDCIWHKCYWQLWHC